MIKSEQVLSPQNYIMAITGDCLIINGDNDVEFIRKALKRKKLKLKDYAFAEIERIVSEKITVVLVDCMVCDDKTDELKHVYQWFEVPEDFEETNL